MQYTKKENRFLDALSAVRMGLELLVNRYLDKIPDSYLKLFSILNVDFKDC
ncbi:MAG: hypothetical protein IKP81_00620 [Paludibacteraceae bacterium]|nr:hypothetical protein [Paludibacteraceae bacterium]